QRVGGFASGACPSPVGPRNSGQGSEAAAVAKRRARMPEKARTGGCMARILVESRWLARPEEGRIAARRRESPPDSNDRTRTDISASDSRSRAGGVPSSLAKRRWKGIPSHDGKSREASGRFRQRGFVLIP